MGVAVLADEDWVDDGGEDFGYGGRVGAGLSQGAGSDKLLPSVTHFQEVDEVSQKFMASDSRGRFPASFDGAAKAVDPVGWGEVGSPCGGEAKQGSKSLIPLSINHFQSRRPP